MGDKEAHPLRPQEGSQPVVVEEGPTPTLGWVLAGWLPTVSCQA